MSHRLIEGSYLAQLVSGSFEHVVALVDEAVEASSETFGMEVRLVGTQAESAVVALADGRFCRVPYKVTGGAVTLGEAVFLDVPTRESGDMAGEVREHTRRAVVGIASGDADAARASIDALVSMMDAGVPMTAEVVAERIEVAAQESGDWYGFYKANRQAMESAASVRSPALSEWSAGTPEAMWQAAHEHIAATRETVSSLRESMAGVAGADAAEMLEFVGSLEVDLEMWESLAGDALSMVRAGDVGDLGSAYAVVARVAPDMRTAACAAESFVRRVSARPV